MRTSMRRFAWTIFPPCSTSSCPTSRFHLDIGSSSMDRVMRMSGTTRPCCGEPNTSLDRREDTNSEATTTQSLPIDPRSWRRSSPVPRGAMSLRWILHETVHLLHTRTRRSSPHPDHAQPNRNRFWPARPSRFPAPSILRSASHCPKLDSPGFFGRFNEQGSPRD